LCGPEGAIVPRSTVRTHVIIPVELLETIDRLVGRRGRSTFLAEAAAEKLARALSVGR
jgi:metal-responsive CopG/Arc/MetJ family transcriptional regulator